MKYRLPFCTVLLILFSFKSHSNGADCDNVKACTAKGELAGKRADFNSAEKYFLKSLSFGETHKAHYLLGQVYLENGDLENAYFAFNSAYSLASSDMSKSSSLAMLALVKFKQNQFYEASSLIRASSDLVSKRPSWIEELSIKIDTKKASTQASSEQINRALTLSTRFVHSSSPAKLDLPLNFKYDSDQLERSSLKLIPELKESLKSHKGKTLTIIGHTDINGSEAYNMNLSKRRALALKNILSIETTNLNIDVLTEGRGESEPLYQGNTEAIHKLNRRVEINVK
jgi:outer membrane protein OmpA-like peptidoglycan-associated protein